MSVCNRRSEQKAHNAICKEQRNQNETSYVNCVFRYPAEQFLPYRLQQVMKRQSHKAETYHTSKADNPFNIQEQPTVIPQPQTKKTDTYVTDDILHYPGNCNTKQEQKHRMRLQRLQCINPKGSNPIDRQPGPIQNTTVPKHSFRYPIEDFLINPPHKATNDEDQKNITQPIHRYPSAVIVVCTA